MLDFITTFFIKILIDTYKLKKDKVLEIYKSAKTLEELASELQKLVLFMMPKRLRNIGKKSRTL